jgi:hypothetical protein
MEPIELMRSSYEDNTRTYVLRMWLEEDLEDDESIRWRGHITNVLTHEQIHVQTMASIIEFLEQELTALTNQNR